VTSLRKAYKIRQAVNRWIRVKGNFDAVVDFAAVVRDPQHPARLKKEFDPGEIPPAGNGSRLLS
jgi:hypothetical protein